MDYRYYLGWIQSWNYSVERRNTYKGREAAWKSLFTSFATELKGDVSRLSAVPFTNQEYWHFQVHSDEQLWKYQETNYLGHHIVESALIPATCEDDVLGIHWHLYHRSIKKQVTSRWTFGHQNWRPPGSILLYLSQGSVELRTAQQWQLKRNGNVQTSIRGRRDIIKNYPTCLANKGEWKQSCHHPIASHESAESLVSFPAGHK